MKTFERPPGVDVWEPGFLKPRDQYTDEEVKELEAVYKKFVALYGPVDFDDESSKNLKK